MTRLADAAPARDRLRELACRGFHAGYLADRIGMARAGVIAIRLGARRRIYPYTDRAITRVHRELCGTDPADCGIRRADITRTWSLAVQHGWTGRHEGGAA